MIVFFFFLHVIYFGLDKYLESLPVNTHTCLSILDHLVMLYVTRYINQVLELILLSINDGSPKDSASRKDPSVNSQKTEIVGSIKECIELSKLDDHIRHDSPKIWLFLK